MTLFVAFDTVANQQKNDRYHCLSQKKNLDFLKIVIFESFESIQSQASAGHEDDPGN